MPNPTILSDAPLPRFKNAFKPSLIVEVIAADAEFRVGENRWLSVVYRRVDNNRIFVRSKAEFLASFTPIPKS
jgi:hypothetical protein